MTVVLLAALPSQNYAEDACVLWENQTEVNHNDSAARTHWAIRSTFASCTDCRKEAEQLAAQHLAREKDRWGHDQYVQIAQDGLTISITIRDPQASVDISSHSTYQCFPEGTNPHGSNVIP